jgi:drug/metabolite transporter (DMT)-like permease
MAIILVLALIFSLIGLKKTNPATISLVALIGPIITLILNSILLKYRISDECILSVIFILIRCNLVGNRLSNLEIYN